MISHWQLPLLPPVLHHSSTVTFEHLHSEALYSLARAFRLKYPRLGGLNKNLLSHSSRGQKSKIKVLAGLIPSEGLEYLAHDSLLASGG